MTSFFLLSVFELRREDVLTVSEKDVQLAKDMTKQP